MENLQLFIVLLGGYNPGDLLEAHNLFIGVGSDLGSLKAQMKKSWHGATHVDAYMILNHVDGFDIRITDGIPSENSEKEFPMLVIGNIGYYKEGHFTEFHKLMPFVLKNGNDSILEKLKRDPDFSEGQALTESTRSHIDDKHVIAAFDVDDVINVQKNIKGYIIELVPSETKTENVLKLGYQFTDLKKM
jgi:hypothetical protein